jgi:hypothetical protein
VRASARCRSPRAATAARAIHHVCERGATAGALVSTLGLALLARVILSWRAAAVGPLDSAESLRLVIPGSMLALLGLQTVFASFFLSILGMQKRVARSAVVVSSEGLGRAGD